MRFASAEAEDIVDFFCFIEKDFYQKKNNLLLRLTMIINVRSAFNPKTFTKTPLQDIQRENHGCEVSLKFEHCFESEIIGSFKNETIN